VLTTRPRLADLDDQRIQPYEHVRAGVQRPVAPRCHELVELGADPGDLGLRQAGDAIAWAMSSTRRVDTPST
jgi:hypothetical protein